MFLMLNCSLANMVPKINLPEAVSPAVTTYTSSLIGGCRAQKQSRVNAKVALFFCTLVYFWLIFQFVFNFLGLWDRLLVRQGQEVTFGEIH